MSYTVFGTKANGDEAILFRSITADALTARGIQTARIHGYKALRLVPIWTPSTASGYSAREQYITI